MSKNYAAFAKALAVLAREMERRLEQASWALIAASIADGRCDGLEERVKRIERALGIQDESDG